MNKLYQTLGFKVKEVNEEKHEIRAVFSTQDVDRHGEIINQLGWHLDEYLKNPVVLFGHNQFEPAIGKVSQIGIVDGNLEGVIQFAVDEYPFAKTIYNLYKGGFMRAISVGFENNVFEYNEDTDQIILKENTLYEVSTVNVPANSLALAKNKGIDVSEVERHMKDAVKGRKEHVAETDTKQIANSITKAIVEGMQLVAEDIKLFIRTDIAVKTTTQKVETPNAKGGIQKNKRMTNRQLNKGVRQMLAAKKINNIKN